MSTNAFGMADTDTTDVAEPATFSIQSWIKGTTPVTRSVTVYGRPDLMGEIEELKDALVEAQSAPFDDDRPLVKSRATEIAEELEAKRTAMLESAVRFRFRGLRNGEIEELREEMGKDDPNPDDISELDYRCMARQCVAPAGLSWENFRDLHTNLGAYFNRTILTTANQAASGGGVDVPFSSASSALTASSSTN